MNHNVPVIHSDRSDEIDLVQLFQAFWAQKLLIILFIYVVTGGAAATINFGSVVLYSEWVGFSSAIILAYITGVSTAFVLAKLFVFNDSQQSVHRSAIFFVQVNLVAVLQTWAISMGLAYYVLPKLGCHHSCLK